MVERQDLSTMQENTARDCSSASLIEVSCFQKNHRAKTCAIYMVEQRTLRRKVISEYALGIKPNLLKDLMISVWRSLILISSLNPIQTFYKIWHLLQRLTYLEYISNDTIMKLPVYLYKVIGY